MKQQLLKHCLEYVDARLKTVEETLQSHQKSLATETKSSAGDKHETGRAMLQLEMEKAGQQLSAVQQMKETLSKIDPSTTTNIVSLGSVIETNLGTYFLSISAGQLVVAGKTYFALSTSSPIGKLLLGKKEGDQLSWNERKINIYKIF